MHRGVEMYYIIRCYECLVVERDAISRVNELELACSSNHMVREPNEHYIHVMRRQGIVS